MKKQRDIKSIKNRVLILGMFFLLLCNMAGEHMDEFDSHIRYILNSISGFILLLGIALFCYPKKERIEKNRKGY